MINLEMLVVCITSKGYANNKCTFFTIENYDVKIAYIKKSIFENVMFYRFYSSFDLKNNESDR